MLDFIVRTISKFLLSLRYRIWLIGLDKISAKGKTGIVFLPNHPALIDPIIMFAHLHGRFAPRGFADQDQVNRPVIGFIARRWGIRTVPSIATYGPSAKAEIEKVLDETIDGLKRGENLVLWPAGRVYHGYKESLGANSSVERILQKYPDVRIVLVRTRGLWGSSFGWASGKEPLVKPVLLKGVLQLLVSFIFFAPRRKVTIEFFEPPDLPRGADRNTFNRFLEDFYNADAPPNTYVPYTLWEKGGTRTLPEPITAALQSDYSKVPAATRQIVLKYLSEKTGVSNLKETDRLAGDLGMDSLARTDLLLWLEKEFGFRQADADAMQTIGDVMLAACGQFVYLTPISIKPAPAGWCKPRPRLRCILSAGDTITDVFLKQASRQPGRVVIADQIAGAKSYRDIITACLVLRPLIKQLEGDRVGIMLPASVTADIVYLATLFAEKVPVMVNWTAGPRNILSSLDSVGVKHILTSKALVDRIAMQGIDLSSVAERLCFLEQFREKISFGSKLTAWFAAHLSWASLCNAKVPQTAVILFTSGSETVPKAVPLSHSNLLANIREVLGAVKIYETDCLIGFLPPFHSFGLTVTMLLPLLAGAQAVYSPNPTEADTLAKIISAYGVTVLAGTPTFVGGIVRVATVEQLDTLRFAVTGAEKCSKALYDMMAAKCKKAVILEGYGVTECSPIISLNDENAPKPFSIGKLLPSLDCLLLHPESLKPLSPLATAKSLRDEDGPATGVLLVRGPSVFSGYLNFTGKSPFIEIEGKQYYNTGDIVSIDHDGLLTFQGRLKRFAKLGGEMISLPAIESVLESAFATPALSGVEGESDKGPTLAVESTESEQPELVLFTSRDIDREQVNQKIRAAGLSGLHSIRRVIKLDQIPLLGTGKTDYRALKQLLK
ncbi:MAG: AMP-binding protein [Sedimentisphaerales bacterium]|jgi:long-chain-fatty-acid--[acyl-carrier-protein] ligase